MWYLTASVTPKEYTADTVVTFTAQTNTGETAIGPGPERRRHLYGGELGRAHG